MFCYLQFSLVLGSFGGQGAIRELQTMLSPQTPIAFERTAQLPNCDICDICQSSLLAYLPTCLLGYLPTCLLDYLPTPTCLLDYLPTCLLAYLPTCLLAYLATGCLPTCLFAYLPTWPCLLAFQPTCLLAYLPTWLLACLVFTTGSAQFNTPRPRGVGGYYILMLLNLDAAGSNM